MHTVGKLGVMVEPVIDYSVRKLCLNPYYNHPKGCPNYGKRSTCPPKARKLYNVIDQNMPIFVVFNVFDFAAHKHKMREKHPNWTIRQVECCLYWQGTARKQLKERVAKFLNIFDEKGMIPIFTPEACGVNVTATMKSIGAELEWPPQTKTYQVALIGSRIKRS